jgi:hypothetical protein
MYLIKKDGLYLTVDGLWATLEDVERLRFFQHYVAASQFAHKNGLTVDVVDTKEVLKDVINLLK